MSRLAALFRGQSGKPLHPPLTDAAIGAYTVGVLMLVLGALGVEEEPMAHGALLAIGGGLAFTIPAALTGLLDWLQTSKGTALRTTATVHLIAMLAATALFVATFVVHLDGYDAGEVETLSWILGLAGEAVLAFGGFVGGSIVFVYGMRVLGRHDAPVAEALNPAGAEPDEGPPPPG